MERGRLYLDTNCRCEYGESASAVREKHAVAALACARLIQLPKPCFWNKLKVYAMGLPEVLTGYGYTGVKASSSSNVPPYVTRNPPCRERRQVLWLPATLVATPQCQMSCISIHSISKWSLIIGCVFNSRITLVLRR